MISLGLILLSYGCGGAEPAAAPGSEVKTPPPIGRPAASETEKQPPPSEEEIPGFVNVPQLAGRPPEAFDLIYGKPLKIVPIRDNPALMPGEIREYRVAGHPKNLSVRFYQNRARRFNLLLGRPARSARRALDEFFRIDVGRRPADRSGAWPLSEKWRGRIGGVDFVTLYAKREKPEGNFTMLHAEVAGPIRPEK